MLTLQAVRFVFLGVLAISAVARAQALAVVVMDTQGLSESSTRRVHLACVELLEQLAAAPVSAAYEKGRRCSVSDLACQRERAKSPAVALWLQGGKDQVTISAAFWLDGERVVGPKSGDALLDALDDDLRPVLEAIVPGWMKKGWGGVRLAEEPPPGSVLKLDGRVLSGKHPDVLPVTAGAHQLDVLFPDGRAVLQRIDVPEASRTRVELGSSAAPEPGATASRFSLLRVLSYSAWMVGAATLLSAFIVGFVGRSTANGQSPCRPDSRACATIDEALEQQRKAAGYASTANVLLGTGLAFSLAGAGLFTFDVLR